MRKFTLLMLALATCAYVNAQRITVSIAGNGTASYTGDGNWAVSAGIHGPKDVCLDAANNIYFVDRGNAVVRKIAATNGVISTIAGGGLSTASGVAATSASLDPSYMCISSSGNMYITTGNQIRKINLATGIITTVAGSVTATGYSGDGGAAISALLNAPTGICVDATGNLYFVDRGNNVVREIAASTGVISTIAGMYTSPGNSGDGGQATAASLDAPACICVDASGNIYFSDQEPNYPAVFSYSTIRKIAAGTHIISTIAGNAGSTATTTGGCPATGAELGTITGMCCDDSGNVYCCEMSCSCHELEMSSGMFNLVAGNFGIESFADGMSSPNANMDQPQGLCVDHNGTVYIADSANHRVRKLIALGNSPVFAFGTGEFIKTNPGPGTSVPITNMLVTADMSAGVSETWRVASAPLHGTLTGLPNSSTSGGTDTVSLPLSYVVYNPPNYATNDQFTVKVTNGNGSTGTVTVYVEVGNTTGVNNVATATTSISIFPNPALSVINVAWNGLQTQDNKIEIEDMAGRTYYSGKLAAGANGNTQVSVQSLPSGEYFLRVNNGDAQKFVKE